MSMTHHKKPDYRIGFWILLVCLLWAVLTSCGARKVATKIDKKEEIQSEKEAEQTEQREQSSFKIDRNIKVKENSENTEWTITKVFYENGNLKSEQVQRRKGTKINEKRYQDKKTQTTDKQIETNKEHLTLNKKVSRSKEKESEREDGWVLYVVVLLAGISLWELVRRKIIG